MKRLLTLCRVGFVSGVIVVGMLISLPVQAGKPDKPGGGGGHAPSGKVFYQQGQGSPPQLYWHMVNPDGSGDITLPAGVNGAPSMRPHGEHYWFLETRAIEGQTYDDGRQRYELFAVRDDANPDYVFQLTDDPLLEVMVTEWVLDSGVITPAAAHWKMGDAVIGFLAVEHDGTGGIVEGGIYVADVYADGDDNPIGASTPMLYFGGSEADGWITIDEEGAGKPNIGDFDFSPDMSAVVFDGWDPAGLYVYQSDPQELNMINGPSGDPVWSPAVGGKIAFGNSTGGIDTIYPDGSGKSTLVASGGGPKFSPDGENVAYVHLETKKHGLLIQCGIYRIPARGGASTVVVPLAEIPRALWGWSE